MKTSPAQMASGEHYFVPQPSLYPVILSGGMFLLALGFIQAMNSFPLGKWVMLGGFGGGVGMGSLGFGGTGVAVAIGVAVAHNSIGESQKLYLAVILDLCSRFAVGWALSAVNDRRLTLAALESSPANPMPFSIA